MCRMKVACCRIGVRHPCSFRPPRTTAHQAQVVPADVNGDGTLELLAVDAVGSVAAWTASGSSLWEVQTSAMSAQPV